MKGKRQSIFLLLWLLAFASMFSTGHIRVNQPVHGCLSRILAGETSPAELHNPVVAALPSSAHDGFQTQFHETRRREPKDSERRHKRSRVSKAFITGPFYVFLPLSYHVYEYVSFVEPGFSSRHVVHTSLRGPPFSA